MLATAAPGDTTGFQFPIMNFIGKIIGSLVPVISFAEGFKASPDTVEIGYNENVTLDVGCYNLETGQFEDMELLFFLAARFARFTAEFPNGNSAGLFVTFNPPTCLLNETHTRLQTKMRISLTAPPITTEPVQSMLIRVKVEDVWVCKNLWWGEGPGQFFFKKVSWPLGAIFGGFGKWSGQTLSDFYDVDINVVVKPYHAATLEPLSIEELRPNDIVSIPVLVENRGNYKDTFGFRIINERASSQLRSTENNTITLLPGEWGKALIAVAVPANLLDTGSLHSLRIEAYSVEQPNVTIASQRLPIQTQGWYVSELTGISAAGSLFLFLGGLFFVGTMRRRVTAKRYQKPVKPWKIPEERQYLLELKKTDPNAYRNELSMMEEEYESALLWFKHYRRGYVTVKPKAKPKTTAATKRQRRKAPSLAFVKRVKLPTLKRTTRSTQPVTDKRPALFKAPAPRIPQADLQREQAVRRIERQQAKLQRQFDKR